MQKLPWQDAINVIEQVQPSLAAIINEINPDHNYELIKATYSYGELIVKNGCLQMPNAESREKSTHNFKEELNYSLIPLALILNKSIEIFLQDGLRTIPLQIFYPGDFFGVFETTNFMFNQHNHFDWNISAGLRSIFMLPKINEASGIKRLKEQYSLPMNLQLRRFCDHWQAFTSIAARANFTKPWEMDILLFPQRWLTNQNDPKWHKFYQYLFAKAWERTQLALTNLNLTILWKEYEKVLAKHKTKLKFHILDTAKQLFMIAHGLLPAFKTLDTSEIHAPIIEIQKAFTEVYMLNDYLPSIMGPTMLTSNVNTTGFYSLHFPISFFNLASLDSYNSFMEDLKAIKLLIETISNSQALVPFNKGNFVFFHNDVDKNGEIKTSCEILQSDPLFNEDKQRFPNRTACLTSSFWRGCIRITV